MSVNNNSTATIRRQQDSYSHSKTGLHMISSVRRRHQLRRALSRRRLYRALHHLPARAVAGGAGAQPAADAVEHLGDLGPRLHGGLVLGESC
jgi:hypothetical protein